MLFGPSTCPLQYTQPKYSPCPLQYTQPGVTPLPPRTLRRRLKDVFVSNRVFRQHKDKKSEVASREADSMTITNSVMTPTTRETDSISSMGSCVIPSSPARGFRGLLGWKKSKKFMERLKSSTSCRRYTRHQSRTSLSSMSTTDDNGYRIMSWIRAQPVVESDQEKINTCADTRCHCFPPMVNIAAAGPGSSVARDMRCMVPRQLASSLHHTSELDGKLSPCYNSSPSSSFKQIPCDAR